MEERQNLRGRANEGRTKKKQVQDFITTAKVSRNFYDSSYKKMKNRMSNVEF